MGDCLERYGLSLLQHGKSNDRIYLMKLDERDYPGILKHMDTLAASNRYTKIFAKIPPFALDGFLNDGYAIEATIPGFFNRQEDAYFLGKFLDPARKIERFPEKVKDIVQTAVSKPPIRRLPIPEGMVFQMASPADAEAIATVYREVFETYPFPIQDPEYIRRTMNENFIYFCLWAGDELAAVSSSEIYRTYGNVEMTDFATLPRYRGNGCAQFLLQRMEEEMRQLQLTGAYTIARAYSYGMNITFARNGYRFAGTLTNNTHISGALESMNIWYKYL